MPTLGHCSSQSEVKSNLFCWGKKLKKKSHSIQNNQSKVSLGEIYCISHIATKRRLRWSDPDQITDRRHFPLQLFYNQKHLLSGFDEIDANEAHCDHEKEVGQSSRAVHPTQLVNISSLDHMNGDVCNWESLRQVPTERLTEVAAWVVELRLCHDQGDHRSLCLVRHQGNSRSGKDSKIARGQLILLPLPRPQIGKHLAIFFPFHLFRTRGLDFYHFQGMIITMIIIIL